MAHVRTLRYGAGRPARPPERFIEEIQPLKGFHGGRPAYKLGAGYTPASRNFVRNQDAITPRSGLSLYAGGVTKLGAVIGGGEMFDIDGNVFAVAASGQSIAVIDALDPSWRTLSPQATTPSGSTFRYWDTAFVYNPARRYNIAVLTNDIDLPKTFGVGSGVAAYSDFTFSADLAKRAKSVIVADERLVWGNVSTDGDGRKSQRVAWSVRGNPTNYTLALGAGFRDIPEMRGEITRLIEDSEGFLILTNHELWRARPRRDTFAFEFFAISRELSCPFPQTAVRTPLGTIFLAGDYEVYLIAGSGITPLGRDPDEPQGNSRIQSFLRANLVNGSRAFALYNRKLRRYELYFATGSADYPDHALFYDVETNSWWEQRLPWETSYGFDVVDTGVYSGAPKTWDEQTVTWDNLTGVWDNLGIERSPIESRDVLTFSSNGTAYRFRSTQTTDNGTAIDCRWRSHALRSQSARQPFDRLGAVWVEYNAPSASSATLLVDAQVSVVTLATATALSLKSSALSYEFVGANQVGRAPQFELQLSDGGTPQFTAFEAEVVRHSRRRGDR